MRTEREVDERQFRSRSREHRSRSFERNQRGRHFERSGHGLHETHEAHGFREERQTHRPSGSGDRPWEGARMSRTSSPLRRRSPDRGLEGGSPGRHRPRFGSGGSSRNRAHELQQPGSRGYITDDDHWHADDRDFFRSRDSDCPRGGDDSFHGDLSMDAGSGRECSYPGELHGEEKMWSAQGRLRHRLGPSPDRFDDWQAEEGQEDGAYSEHRYSERRSRRMRESHRSPFEERHSLSRGRYMDESLLEEVFEREGDLPGNPIHGGRGRSRGLLPTPDRFSSSEDWTRGHIFEGATRDRPLSEREVVLKDPLQCDAEEEDQSRTPDHGENRRGDWRQVNTPSSPGPHPQGSFPSSHPFPGDRRHSNDRSGQHRSPFHAEGSRDPMRHRKREKGEFPSESQGPSLQEKIHDFLDEARHSSSRGPSPSDEQFYQSGIPSTEDAAETHGGDLEGTPPDRYPEVEISRQGQRPFQKHQQRGGGRHHHHHNNPELPSRRRRGPWDREESEPTFGEEKRRRISSSGARSSHGQTHPGHTRKHPGDQAGHRQGIKVRMVFNRKYEEVDGVPHYLDLDQPRPEEEGLAQTPTEAEEDYYRDSFGEQDPAMEGFLSEDSMNPGPRSQQEDVGDMIQAQRARVMRSDLRNLLKTRRKWRSSDAEKEHIQIRVRRQEHQEHVPRQQYTDDDGREVLVADTE